MRIRTRLLLLLIPAILVSLSLLALVNYYNASRQEEAFATAEARRIASEQSTLIFNKLRQAEGVAASMAGAYMEMRTEETPDRETMSLMAKGAAASSSDFFGVWVLWEPDAFDGKDKDFIGNETLGNKEGRANAYWLREQGNELSYDPSDDYDHEPYYLQPKGDKRLTLVPPYRDLDTAEKTLMSTVAMPLMDKGTFLGAIGIDIEMEFIQGLLKAVTPFETGYAVLISNTGDIVSDPLNTTVSDSLPSVSADVRDKVRSGQPFVITDKSSRDGSPVLCYYTPVKLESFAAPWYFMVALPLNKVTADAKRSLFIQLGVSLLALALLVGLVFYTANGVATPLRRIVSHANGIASGKYDGTLDTRGFARELMELYEALRLMVRSLLDTMQKVEESSAESARGAEKARQAMGEAEQARKKTESDHKAMMEVAMRVDAVSQKVSETSQELTGKITAAGRKSLEQNDLMSATASSITAMSDSIVSVSANAEDAAQYAERTGARANEGASIVNRTLEAVDGIRNEIETLDKQIAVLSKNTEAVGGILGLINDIADQTNLLALNAAIEAARAGEAGRGFAVVADEVRKLAEKTVEATRQVAESIKSIRDSMTVSAGGVERTAQTVRATVELGHEAQQSLGDIVALVQGMNEQIHNIARLCRDQARTSEQVSSAVEGLRSLSINVSEAMREGADISNTLVPEAKELSPLTKDSRQSDFLHLDHYFVHIIVLVFRGKIAEQIIDIGVSGDCEAPQAY